LGQIWDFLIVQPIAFLLRGLYGFVHNYGVAILLFAVAAKLVLLFFSFKGKRGMLQQQRLQPKIAELQKKYGKDKQKMQQEQANLYQKEGVSMFGGCIWALIPFPLIIALYGAVRQPLTYIMQIPPSDVTVISETLLAPVTSAQTLLDAAGAEATIASGELKTAQDTLAAAAENAKDAAQLEVDAAQRKLDAANAKKTEAQATLDQVSADNKVAVEAGRNGTLELYIANKLTADEDFYREIEGKGITGLQKINFNFLGLNLAAIPSFNSVLLLIPILSALTSFLSVWLTQKFSGRPAAGGSSMLMMYLLGPGISLWLGFSWPAAIGLYWIIQNVLGIPQEYYLTKFFNKKLDEEDARKAALEERRKAAEAAQKEEDRQRRAERIAEQNQKRKPKRYKLKPTAAQEAEESDGEE
jgi:YidC/Oxa1 family membrane protein insertase